jgi:hypothetical protein
VHIVDHSLEELKMFWIIQGQKLGLWGDCNPWQVLVCVILALQQNKLHTKLPAEICTEDRGLSPTICDNTDTSSCIHIFKIFFEFLFSIYIVRQWMGKNCWILTHTLYFVCFLAELHKYWHKNYVLQDESNSLKVICITMESYYIIKQI